MGCAERIRSSIGAMLGLMLTLTIAKAFGEFSGISMWLMASLWASTLLVFALLQSPIAQPLAVIAGNTVSALVGIASVHSISKPLLALPIAAAISIMAMFIMRCLHPPAAAVALIVVFGHIEHYRYSRFWLI